ncbi:hypothetical Protein YC6258_01905 [Gynuella sunshinyii YC6258]|uniref:Uncharacterized protein n=1 Tax=Gynuella sunshinyii YC6258 TaxID=1445510 RepID=A0A0C5VU73_9GAMM|nr:hypothetical Protein YC6258_01905 [Gynuella sunshinyii YC6258]
MSIFSCIKGSVFVETCKQGYYGKKMGRTLIGGNPANGAMNAVIEESLK